MAMPSDRGTKQDVPARAFDMIRNVVGQVRQNAVNLRNESTVADISAERVIRFVALLQDSLETLDRWVAVPGTQEIIRQQTNNPSFDLTSEYSTLRAAIVTCRNWIIANFPKDGADYLLYHKFNAQGKIVPRMFFPAQLAELHTELDTLVAAID